MNNKTAQIKQIALSTLDLETLETQNSDSLDFHDIAIWRIKDALEAAYAAGERAHTRKNSK